MYVDSKVANKILKEILGEKPRKTIKKIRLEYW